MLYDQLKKAGAGGDLNHRGHVIERLVFGCLQFWHVA
jgi:hypothetical protein